MHKGRTGVSAPPAQGCKFRADGPGLLAQTRWHLELVVKAAEEAAAEKWAVEKRAVEKLGAEKSAAKEA